MSQERKMLSEKLKLDHSKAVHQAAASPSLVTWRFPPKKSKRVATAWPSFPCLGVQNGIEHEGEGESMPQRKKFVLKYPKVGHTGGGVQLEERVQGARVPVHGVLLRGEQHGVHVGEIHVTATGVDATAAWEGGGLSRQTAPPFPANP